MIRVCCLSISLAMALVAAGCRSEEPQPVSACSGQCAESGVRLTQQDVEKVIAQAVREARARNTPATIAVVDRVGNVLAVFRMTGADTQITIDSGLGVEGGLEQIAIIPDTLAAITKAITGAYLSSEGSALSTRTASQIVQQHFNPGELGQPGGPLFGVQFSQLPCSDLNTRNSVDVGPQRSPLGLSADPGGFPLYKNGTPVGGVGVMADGLYSLDIVITDVDTSVDEYIALAATQGFAPPDDRNAERITIDGKLLRYSDARSTSFASNPQDAVYADALLQGNLVAVTGYNNGTIQAGTRFGFAESGIRPAGATFAGLNAYVLVDENNLLRFTPRAGTDGLLTQAEVTQILQSALQVANKTRSQIRRPLGSSARVSISVVDTNGNVLGIVRTADAPVFGTDVSLQKARTATFYSSANAAAALQSVPPAQYLANSETSSIGNYVTRVRNFLGRPTALSDGAIAFTDRSGGNLSRPFYPDGIDATSNGPFSKPIDEWSPFSTGLQLDLVNNAILQHVVFVLGGGPDVGNNCTGIPQLPNGIQIFPGSVPIYRGGQLIGGIGVSGDGVDQDDMIAFLGLHNAGEILGSINNAPAAMRSDTLTPQGVHLRYVQCPQKPFLNSEKQNVCEGK